MDILDVIKAEHREVGALIDSVASLQPDDAQLREIAQQISKKLEIHAQIEERLLYARLRDRAKDDDALVDVFEGYIEHDVTSHLIGLTRSKRKPDERFKAELQVLGEGVKHHVKEEESRIFSIAKGVIDADEREQLGTQWERAKERLLNAGGAKKSSSAKKTARKKTASKKTTRATTAPKRRK